MSVKNGKKKWIIAIVAVVLVVAIFIGVIVSNSASTQSSETTSGSVELITKRTIANSITANGVVESAESENVTGGSYGAEVEKVYVEVGDVVAAGDIICVFNTEDIDEQIADIKERIADTETDRAEQNADYDQQMVDNEVERQEDLAEAQANLAEAQKTLEEEEAELAKREQEYNDYIASKETSTEEPETEEDTEESTEGTTEGETGSNLDGLLGGVSGDSGDSGVSTVEQAPSSSNIGTSNYIQDEATLKNQVDSQKNVVESAQTRVDTYQAQVDSLESQNNSNLEDTKKSYNDQVDSTIESYNEQLEAYNEQKEEATIKAGMSGTVTAVNVTEGTTFSGGVVATIENAGQFIVEAEVDEYDIADVEIGMKVLAKTDATRDAELEGVVTYVAPRATNSGNASNSLSSLMGGLDTSSFTSSSSSSATYLVKIELNEQNERLRLGMNAKTSIITEEKKDVWSVPYDAVYTRADGTNYLEQVTGTDEEGNLITKELDVEIGIQGTYYVEVISTLINEETEILIPDAQGNSSIEELLNMMGADAGI